MSARSVPKKSSTDKKSWQNPSTFDSPDPRQQQLSLSAPDRSSPAPLSGCASRRDSLSESPVDLGAPAAHFMAAPFSAEQQAVIQAIVAAALAGHGAAIATAPPMEDPEAKRLREQALISAKNARIPDTTGTEEHFRLYDGLLDDYL